MKVDDFVHLYSELHHMSEGGSWGSIQRIGLRTTRQLVEESGAYGTTRQNILGQRRTSEFSLTHPVVGQVTIRDQKPLIVRHLDLR